MSENIILESKTLIEVRTGKNHDEVHQAWKDDTNDGFLICYEIELVFDDESTYSLCPSEIELEGRYPALGLELKEGKVQVASFQLKTVALPSKLTKIENADHLGEGVTNQIVFTLDNGKKVIVRHVFPPMTLGIKVEASNA
jgi:hypothetical protein